MSIVLMQGFMFHVQNSYPRPDYASYLDYAQTVGGRLRWALDHWAGITPSELARKLGKPRQTVSRWLNDDEHPPKEESLELVAEEIALPVQWLRYGGDLADFVPHEVLYPDEGDGGKPNRAFSLIGRMEHPSAIRRAEGELHYGDLAAGGLVEAKEKRYDLNEVLTLAEWMAEKLRESERNRLALQRRIRELSRQPGEESGPAVRDS
jgi:transcriptional regulator with XRE-family HTH domain